MSAYNCGINHHVFVVGIACQQLEDPLENAALHSTAEPLMYRFPVAEARRQITPWNTSSKPVQNSFDEQPVISCRSTYMACAAGQEMLYPVPLVIP
jgi:hypothetical protein